MNVTQSTVVCVDVAAHDLDRDAPLLGHFVDAHGAIDLPKEMAAQVLCGLPTFSEIGHGGAPVGDRESVAP
jgi:hypothetical protein